MNTNKHEKLLYKELSYQIQGAAIEVRKNFGSGLKETIYQNAFAEELKSRGISFEKEKNIKIYSPKTGKIIGYYRPDFIVENKIIVEIKAVEKIPRNFIDQLYDYLKNSEYELGYFINFASPKLYMRRIIFTNDRKFFKLKNFLVALSFILVAISVLPVSAAELKLSSPDQEVGVGSQFRVDLILDPQNEDLNALEGKIVFSDNLKFISLNDAGSLVSLWIERPSVAARKDTNTNEHEIVFSGIMPGGYRGELSAYWQGYRPGRIFSAVFRVAGAGPAQVKIEDAKVLLNDGKGTEAGLTISDFQANIKDVGRPYISDVQRPEIEDIAPPEEFTPEIARDPNIFDGKYFLVFVTQDKGTGISHYEVCEGKRKCVEAESPYLLQNQNLDEEIIVKALDKSGNVRTAYLPAPKPRPWYKNWQVWIIIILGVLTLYIIGKILWRIYTKKHK